MAVVPDEVVVMSIMVPPTTIAWPGEVETRDVARENRKVVPGLTNQHHLMDLQLFEMRYAMTTALRKPLKTIFFC
jgi:hypothetical protein